MRYGFAKFESQVAEIPLISNKTIEDHTQARSIYN
jgi:hypothetical protein